MVAVVVEDQLRVAGRGEPVMMVDLAFELSWSPAGIAKGEKALLRPLVVADVAQDLLVRGHRHDADGKGVGAMVLGAVHDKTELRLDRAAGKDQEAAVDPGGLITGPLQQALDGALFYRAVDDDAESA